MPFVLLPFRPVTQSSDCRNFIRTYFKCRYDGTDALQGANLKNDLRLTEPLVRLTKDLQIALDKTANYAKGLCSIIKWCWSRLPGGVVTWDVYDLFCKGEKGR